MGSLIGTPLGWAEQAYGAPCWAVQGSRAADIGKRHFENVHTVSTSFWSCRGWPQWCEPWTTRLTKVRRHS